MPEPIIIKLRTATRDDMLKPRKQRHRTLDQERGIHVHNRRLTKAKEKAWAKRVRVEKRASSYTST